MKPLIYGYMRADDDIDDRDILRLERAFKKLADTESLSFATTFYEYAPGRHSALSELAQELERTAAHHVVMPSLCHLSHHPIIRRLLLTRLSLAANAQVWVIEPCAATNPLDLTQEPQTIGVVTLPTPRTQEGVPGDRQSDADGTIRAMPLQDDR